MVIDGVFVGVCCYLMDLIENVWVLWYLMESVGVWWNIWCFCWWNVVFSGEYQCLTETLVLFCAVLEDGDVGTRWCLGQFRILLFSVDGKQYLMYMLEFVGWVFISFMILNTLLYTGGISRLRICVRRLYVHQTPACRFVASVQMYYRYGLCSA